MVSQGHIQRPVLAGVTLKSGLGVTQGH